MKKMILSVALLCAASAVRAQATLEPHPAPDTVAVSATERSEWLASFTAVEVSAPAEVVFVKVPATQAPRIVYDTKGSYTSKFRTEVRDKKLRITERRERGRTDRTKVAVYYNELETVEIVDASVAFEGGYTATMLDLYVAGDARVEARLDVGDLSMELTGHSTAVLTGKARYLWLYASTGKVDAAGLETLAAKVNAASSAEVSVWVTDRFEGKTSTGGKITFKGSPAIVRGGTKFMGGDIKHVQQ